MVENAKNPLPEKLDWNVRYEGPAIGRLLSYQIFMECFKGDDNLLGETSNFYYDYYLFYTDRKEAGGLHGGYYVKEDLDRALKVGEKNYFDEEWLNRMYELIDTDSDKAADLMEEYPFEKSMDSIDKEKALELYPIIRELELRLLSFVRCSQPQFTDALQNKMYEILRERIKDDKLVEKISVELTLPEEKSLFTQEEIDWLDIVVDAVDTVSIDDAEECSRELISEKYPELAQRIQKHFETYTLIPASDRTPAWDHDHFYEILKTALLSSTDFKKKKEHILEQYTDVLKKKRKVLEEHDLPEEALILGSKIAKVGFYRFKASFYWRWMGYYMVLLCHHFKDEYGLSFEEMSSMTKEEFVETLKTNTSAVPKEELEKRADCELFLHVKGKDYIWSGEEARKIKEEILGIPDYTKLTELKGEVGSVGSAKGKAYVFYWSDDVVEKMRKMPEGSILVAPQTHPTYMPAIRIAQALVCDEGGVTGHAAIVSRELKKPCVIGLHIATKAIQAGDELEVDAHSGVVKILKRAS